MIKDSIDVFDHNNSKLSYLSRFTVTRLHSVAQQVPRTSNVMQTMSRNFSIGDRETELRLIVDVLN